MADKPVILLTNDDGVQAEGLRALHRAVQHLGTVIVVAPTHEQSASSHAITIDRPLRHIEHSADVHSIDGTPADCVYLAFFEARFLPRRPDVVLSGINYGSNLGTSVFYSGTVAGAREAAMRGVPSIAFSAQRDEEDLDAVAAQAAQYAARFLQAQHPEGPSVLLNVNFPPWPPKGSRVTRVGRQTYEENVIPRRDPGGREYFWIGGKLKQDSHREGTDAQAVVDGYTSITPLNLEATCAEHLAMAAHVGGTQDHGGEK